MHLSDGIPEGDGSIWSEKGLLVASGSPIDEQRRVQAHHDYGDKDEVEAIHLVTISSEEGLSTGSASLLPEQSRVQAHH